MSDSKAQNYFSNHQIQHDAIVEVLSACISEMKYFNCCESSDDDTPKKVIDIGCGPGDVTSKVLAPLLPPSVKTLIGIDLCREMILFAKSNFEDERIHFELADISKAEFSEKYFGFDAAFSFFTIQWVEDWGKVAITNLYQLLKPQGEVFLLFVGESSNYRMHERLAQTPKWRSLLQTYSPQRFNEFDFAESLSKAGFEIPHPASAKKIYYFKSPDRYADWLCSLTAINPLLSRILPSDRVQDFNNDLRALAHSKNIDTYECTLLYIHAIKK